MNKTKIKIFEDIYPGDLEKKLNTFIENNDIEVSSIEYSIQTRKTESYNGFVTHHSILYSVMLVYKQINSQT